MTGRPAKRRRTAVLPWLAAAIGVPLLCVLALRWGSRRYMTALYPIAYEQTVTACAQEYGVPASLIYAVIRTESSFDPSAVSSADAKGLMQLTDDTFAWALSRSGDADRYTAEDVFDPQVNIRYGTCVLSLLGQQFSDTATVLAAYNAGQGRVRQWLAEPRYSPDGVQLDHIPYPETAAYVQRVTAAQQHYRVLYGLP